MSGNNSDDSFYTAQSGGSRRSGRSGRTHQSSSSAERERQSSSSPESDGSGPYPPSTSSSSRQSQSQYSQSQYSQSQYSQYSQPPAAAPTGDSGWTRASNAALAAAPLAGQSAAMLAAQYSSDPTAAVQGYGGGGVG
ncbi:hypothetical protein, partial [Streptomyces hirsutus]|uniref:hypothetical protein n=1 Tax=Streptomyces hirsutus TaxID=35620 RepID=UPI000A466B6C